MTTPPHFKLAEFEFVGTSWRSLGAPTLARFAAFLGITPLMSPVVYKARRGVAPNLVQLGEAIGFDDPSLVSLLVYHRRRLMLRLLPILGLYLLIFVFVMFVLAFAFVFLPDVIPLMGTGPGAAISSIFWYILGFLGFTVGLKIVSIIVDRYFADSLFVYTIISLNLQLSQDDCLQNPGRKVEVLHRMHHLARNAQLLSLRFFSRDSDSQAWVRKHFNHLARYIRERERWVIAPRQSTLADLRRDFYGLAETFVAGQYGEFSWIPEQQPEQMFLTWRQRLIGGGPRLLGLLLPLAILLLFIWRRSYFEPLGLTPNVVGLMLIAWLLLALDSVLKLGIVAGLVSLAKGIKDLK